MISTDKVRIALEAALSYLSGGECTPQAERDLREQIRQALWLLSAEVPNRDDIIEACAKLCDQNAAACDAGYRKSGGVDGYALQAEGARECADLIRGLKGQSAPSTVAQPTAGAYRWIAQASALLKLWLQCSPTEAEGSMLKLQQATDGLLSGVPCPQEDLGFDSPADRAARSSTVPRPVQGYKLVHAGVLAWLHGEAPHPTDGVWFERPEGAGAYWWRSKLRHATLEDFIEDKRRESEQSAIGDKS